MSRKAISKATRLAVYDKCNHRCAYCGCELEYKDMQVDHIEAVYLNEYNKERNYKVLNDEHLIGLMTMFQTQRVQIMV